MSSKEISIPKSLLELLESCQTTCVYECCGLDAADFTSDQMRSYIADKREEHRNAILGQIDQVLESLRGQAETEAGSSALNAWWPKAEATLFFEGIRRDYAKAMEWFGKP